MCCIRQYFCLLWWKLKMRDMKTLKASFRAEWTQCIYRCLSYVVLYVAYVERIDTKLFTTEKLRRNFLLNVVAGVLYIYTYERNYLCMVALINTVKTRQNTSRSFFFSFSNLTIKMSLHFQKDVLKIWYEVLCANWRNRIYFISTVQIITKID